MMMTVILWSTALASLIDQSDELGLGRFFNESCSEESKEQGTGSSFEDQMCTLNYE